jgi:hypothetical protein
MPFDLASFNFAKYNKCLNNLQKHPYMLSQMVQLSLAPFFIYFHNNIFLRDEINGNIATFTILWFNIYKLSLTRELM